MQKVELAQRNLDLFFVLERFIFCGIVVLVNFYRKALLPLLVINICYTAFSQHLAGEAIFRDLLTKHLDCLALLAHLQSSVMAANVLRIVEQEALIADHALNRCEALIVFIIDHYAPWIL